MNINKSGRANGFSLIEIMVGMTIGLVTVLVVSQVMQVAEARKRASSSGTDAIVNTALGLYTIEREGKNAGFGITSVRDSVGCLVRRKYNSGATEEFGLVPVAITDGPGGLPDSLRFLSSNKNGILLPTKISVDHAQSANSFYVESDMGITSGDMMIAVTSTLDTNPTPTRWCTMFQVAGVSGGQNQVPHDAGASLWNQTAAASIMPATGYIAGDYLINLGKFVDHTYSVYAVPDQNKYSLRLNELDSTNDIPSTQDVFPDIVQLQAVYGKDTSVPPDNTVDVWEANAPASAAQWQQIRAIRVALVARSQNMESGVVTLDGAAAASTCDSDTPHPAAVCWRPDPAGHGVKIDVNADGHNPNWQRYRYRVMESTIPIRNLIWQQ